MRDINTFVRRLARFASAAPPTVLPYAVTRVALGAVAIVAAARLPAGNPCSPCDPTSSTLVNALSRWDGRWYLSIARDGYSYAPGSQSNVAFSPLLPALMRGLAWLSGDLSDGRLLLAGAVIANAALLIALAYLVALGRLELGEGPARRATVYLLIFPTTIFLSAVYPESLFLACAVATVLEARRGRWWLAGTFAALGTIARPFGIVLVISLAVQVVADRARGPVRPALVAGMVLPIAAFLAWQAYLYRVSGDALVFLHSELQWSQRPTVPVRSITDLLDPAVYGDPWIVAAALILMTTCVVLSWRLLHPATAAYGTAMLLAVVSSGTLTSFPRYALAIFPAFLVLGALGRRRPVHLGYVGIAGALSIMLTAMFASWYWIG